MHNVIVVLPPTHISIKLNLLYKLPVCDNCSDCFTYPFTSGREREGGIGEGGGGRREGGREGGEGKGGEGRRGEERGWREEGGEVDLCLNCRMDLLQTRMESTSISN